MPIYTYQCESCGVRFDARQKFSDDPITECPECSSHVHRVPQPVGIVFKGSGWYAKDSRGGNNLATPPKKDGESADSPAKSENKPESSGAASSDSGSTASSSTSSDSNASKTTD